MLGVRNCPGEWRFNVLSPSGRAAQPFVQAEATSWLGLTQALGGMDNSTRPGRFDQWVVCLAGVAMLYVGAHAIAESLAAGSLIFTYKRMAFTDEVAGFLIASCVLLGGGLAGTSLRNLDLI